MQPTKSLRFQAVLVLLLYLWITPVFVLGQDPSQDPAPASSTREQPSPEPSTRNAPSPVPTTTNDPPPDTNPPPEPTRPQQPTTTPVPESSTTTISTTPGLPGGTSTTSSDPPTSTQSSLPPTSTGPTCPQTCLAQAARSMGCSNSNDMDCVCQSLDSYISNANSCMQDQRCEATLSSQAIQDARTACSLAQPPGTGSDTTRTPTPTPTSRRPVTTTQTQTLVLTPGEVVTLGVSGTVLTTFTASSSLTTTRVATMLQQDGVGGVVGGGSGGAGFGNGALKIRRGHELGGLFGLVGFVSGVLLVF